MILNTIQNGMRDRKVLRISYVDSKGKHSVRAIEPYSVRGNKLFAHCLARHATRQFDMNKIVNVILTEQTFKPRHEVEYAPFG